MECTHTSIVTCTHTLEMICVECGLVMPRMAMQDEFGAYARAGAVGTTVPSTLQLAQHIADGEHEVANGRVVRETALVTQLLTALNLPIQHLERVINLIESMFRVVSVNRWRGRKRSLLRGACVVIVAQKQGLYVDVDVVCAKVGAFRRTTLYKQVREIRTMLADCGTEADVTFVGFANEIATHVERFARMLNLPYAAALASHEQIDVVLSNRRLNSKAARSLGALCVFSANPSLSDANFAQATRMSLDTTRRLRSLATE